MERFQSDAIILRVTQHGEADALVDAMTQDEGRRRGFVRGGVGRRQRATLQPGNRVRLSWQARTEEHLGQFAVEALEARLGYSIDDSARLSALAAVTAIFAVALPERIAYPRLYAALNAYLTLIGEAESTELMLGAGLVRLEAGLLGELGYGLDLSRCAATNSTDNLSFVSPKSGRAVSEEAAGPYKERLLRLPAFLLSSQNPIDRPDAIIDGLDLTGFFIERHILSLSNRSLPAARSRFRDYFHDHG